MSDNAVIHDIRMFLGLHDVESLHNERLKKFLNSTALLASVTVHFVNVGIFVIV